MTSCSMIRLVAATLAAMTLVCQIANAQNAGTKNTGAAAGVATGVSKAQPKAVLRAVLRASKAARAAFSAATLVKRQATGKKGEPRAEILRAAAKAYEKVAADFAAEPAGAAPAHFAVGQLRRSLGEWAQASASFKKAGELHRERYFTRSAMELAHIERGQKRIPEALQLYQVVAAGEPGSSRGHRARLWIARCLASQGKLDDAVAAYRKALQAAASPSQKIDVCNRLAGQLIRMKDLAAAERLIQQAETASKIKPAGQGAAVERALRSQAKAYTNMSARRALRRARDKADNAHRDAQRVEKSAAAGKK